jgi:hypothetical protein
MDADTESSNESGWEYQLLVNAIQEEEQEFRSSEAEIDATVSAQLANLTKDLR